MITQQKSIFYYVNNLFFIHIYLYITLFGGCVYLSNTYILFFCRSHYDIFLQYLLYYYKEYFYSLNKPLKGMHLIRDRKIIFKVVAIVVY